MAHNGALPKNPMHIKSSFQGITGMSWWLAAPELREIILISILLSR